MDARRGSKNQLENATQIPVMIVSIGPCTLVGMIGGRSISAKRKTVMLMNTKGHNSGPSIRLEKRMAELIVISQYGAYLVDDRMKYYLVQGTSDPWKVEGGFLETDGGVAREGEWVCKGLWLINVDRAPRWFWLSDKEVVFRCQFVLCSNVVLENHNAGNVLPRMNAQYWCSVLQLNPMHLSDETHDVLMDAASLREGLDYVKEIPDSSSETSDDDKETEEEDGTESKSNEYSDSDDE